MIKLKLCQFCGGKAFLVKHTRIHGGKRYYIDYCVECLGCDISMPRSYSEKDAIRYWNTRAR